MSCCCCHEERNLGLVGTLVVPDALAAAGRIEVGTWEELVHTLVVASVQEELDHTLAAAQEEHIHLVAELDRHLELASAVATLAFAGSFILACLLESAMVL